MGVSRILMAGLAVVLFVGVTVGCTPPPPPSGALLAVAYSNVDGIDGFDPSGGDVLIAKLWTATLTARRSLVTPWSPTGTR